MRAYAFVRTMVVAATIVGTIFVAYAKEEAEDDAVVEALNSEIAKVDKRGDGETGKKTAMEDPDSVEIAPSGKRPAKASRKSRGVTSDDDQKPVKKRPSKDAKVVAVTVIGKGETPEEAKLAAFRRAVEKVVGVYVDAESMMKNSELLKDRVNTISNADIKEYDTLKKGKTKDGLYAIQIKAKVEKKAIAPKFADMFPAAFADIGEEAETIHVQKVTRTKRSADAASLMTAALEDVDRMRNWTRLSVVKGKGLEEVTKIKQHRSPDLDIAEVPGKGLYKVRYSIKIDNKAYFEGFLPHFKQVLTKMQEGEAEEEVVLTSGPVPDLSKDDVSDTGDGRKLVMTGGDFMSLPAPFTKSYGSITYFVDPVVLSGFPGTAIGGVRGTGGNPESFMYDRYKGVAKVRDERTFNIWLLDRMNADKTLVRCSAYKVPTSALRAYWKGVYGELDSDYVLGNARDLRTLKLGRFQEQIEIALLDEHGEEIAVRIDRVPAVFLTNGEGSWNTMAQMGVTSLWAKCNVFHSFFIRPMFARKIGYRGFGYSTEIQRDVYFSLTDAQLEKVKRVKVRYVGGGKRE